MARSLSPSPTRRPLCSKPSAAASTKNLRKRKSKTGRLANGARIRAAARNLTQRFRPHGDSSIELIRAPSRKRISLSLDFRGPEAVGQVAFEEAGEGLGEVGEIVASGLAWADTDGAGTNTQWSEEAS